MAGLVKLSSGRWACDPARREFELIQPSRASCGEQCESGALLHSPMSIYSGAGRSRHSLETQPDSIPQEKRHGQQGQVAEDGRPRITRMTLMREEGVSRRASSHWLGSPPTQAATASRVPRTKSPYSSHSCDSWCHQLRTLIVTDRVRLRANLNRHSRDVVRPGAVQLISTRSRLEECGERAAALHETSGPSQRIQVLRGRINANGVVDGSDQVIGMNGIKLRPSAMSV
jgi:hypothetical protein